MTHCGCRRCLNIAGIQDFEGVKTMTAPPDAGFGLWELLIAVGMLVINLVGALIGGTWALARTRQKIDDKIDAVALDLERRLNTETDTTVNRFGETIQAVRQKMTEMELWNRDNFVSKNTFTLVMQDMRDSWRRFEDKLDKRLDAIDAKLNSTFRNERQ